MSVALSFRGFIFEFSISQFVAATPQLAYVSTFPLSSEITKWSLCLFVIECVYLCICVCFCVCLCVCVFANLHRFGHWPKECLVSDVNILK